MPKHRTSIWVHLFIFVVAALMFTLGTAFARDAWQGWSLVRDIDRFEEHPGVIVHARTNQEGKDFVTDIAFRYVVDQKNYEGNNHATAMSYRDAKLASRDANRYRANQKVTLYVDPQQPARATLSRDVPTGRSVVKSIYALLFYGIGIFSLVTHWRSRKKARVLAYARELERQRQQELDEQRQQRMKQT